MRVITIQVDSLTEANAQIFVTWLLQQQADIICLQSQTVITKPLSIKGFQVYTSSLDHTRVAIYTKSIPKAIMTGLSLGSLALDARYLQLDFEHISLVSVLVPEGRLTESASKQIFLEKLQLHLIRLLRKRRREFIICGGWRMALRKNDISDWRMAQEQEGFSPQEQQWLTQIENAGYIDAFRESNYLSEQYTGTQEQIQGRWDYQLTTPAVRHRIIAAKIDSELEVINSSLPTIVDYQLEI